MRDQKEEEQAKKTEEGLGKQEEPGEQAPWTPSEQTDFRKKGIVVSLSLLGKKNEE